MLKWRDQIFKALFACIPRTLIGCPMHPSHADWMSHASLAGWLDVPSVTEHSIRDIHVYRSIKTLNITLAKKVYIYIHSLYKTSEQCKTTQKYNIIHFKIPNDRFFKISMPVCICCTGNHFWIICFVGEEYTISCSAITSFYCNIPKFS